MILPEANESPEHDDENFSLLYEEEDADSEETLTADEVEDLESDKPSRTYQPFDWSIACYGAPEDDEAIKFLDRHYALEDEIALENGEKISLQLTTEQKLKRDVIRSLLEARHN